MPTCSPDSWSRRHPPEYCTLADLFPANSRTACRTISIATAVPAFPVLSTASLLDALLGGSRNEGDVLVGDR